MVQATHAGLLAPRAMDDPDFGAWVSRDHTLVILASDSIEEDIEAARGAGLSVAINTDPDLDPSQPDKPTSAAIGPHDRKRIGRLFSKRALA